MQETGMKRQMLWTGCSSFLCCVSLLIKCWRKNLVVIVDQFLMLCLLNVAVVNALIILCKRGVVYVECGL